jgi:hypothetical protein
VACGVQCTAYKGSSSVFSSQNLGRLTISNVDGLSAFLCFCASRSPKRTL